MKYTMLGFNQEEAIKMNLDLIDLAILRYFVDFRDTNKMVMEIIDDKPFYWIDYKTLIESIPIINIKSKDVLRRRLKKLEDKNILLHFCKKDKGTYSFYAIGPEYEKLLEGATEKSNGTTQKSNGTTQKSNPSYSKVGPCATQKSEQNINLLNNKSNKDIYMSLSFIDDCIDKVKLTEKQYYKLVDKFSKKIVNDEILELDNYITNSKGSKYKDHYKVLLNWCNKEMKNKKVDKPIKEVKPAYHLPFDFSKL